MGSRPCHYPRWRPFSRGSGHLAAPQRGVGSTASDRHFLQQAGVPAPAAAQPHHDQALGAQVPRAPAPTQCFSWPAAACWAAPPPSSVATCAFLLRNSPEARLCGTHIGALYLWSFACFPSTLSLSTFCDRQASSTLNPSLKKGSRIPSEAP